jgi:H+/Cl- antiporter ClcA
VSIRYLPGTSGHSPADGFKAGGPSPTAIELPGVVLASFATLALGVVLGPEAPLIAIGGGLGAWAVVLAKKDAPPMVGVVLAAAGSFAAISALFGSPILGAFLLMEAAGLGGPTLGIVLVPGILAAGIGTLVFVGLNSWTGFGAFSLAIPGLPPFGNPTIAMFGWALVIGAAAALLGTAIHRGGLLFRTIISPRLLVLTPVAGLAIAGLAIAFMEISGHSASFVLFSGQNELPNLVKEASTFSIGALILLMATKGLAYALSLSSFRGGPVFPSMFIGAAGGIALSHVAGLPFDAGMAMGIGAMCAAMLRLPLTSILLGTLLLNSVGLAVIPLVIVAVVVSFVLVNVLNPPAPAVAVPETPASGGPSSTAPLPASA